MIQIPDSEILGNIYSRRAGHTIPAACTAILDTAVDNLHYLVYSLFLLLGKGLKFPESLQVILHLLHGGHTA